MRRTLVLAALVALIAPGCLGRSVVGGPPDAATVDLGTDLGADLGTDLGADLGFDAPVLDQAPVDAPPVRCTRDDDCRGHELGFMACDVASGRCVACTPASDNCPTGQYCEGSTFRCVAGCRDDLACSSAGVDGGASTRHCDPATRRCVDCTTDAHCPAGRVCAGDQCVAGCTATQPCPASTTCCSGACVDTQGNSAHCGGCGMACSVTHGAAACVGGACAVAACTGAYGDCDGDPADGCETDTSTSTAHCGGCGRACSARANSSASCAAGACQYTCLDSFADCDGDPSNGCEVDTRTDLTHCGACGRQCPSGPRSSPTCAAGACGIACAPGYADCDGDAANGCEVDPMSSATHCGACGRACASGQQCEAGLCCAARERNCSGVCRNLNSENANCGACGNVCPSGTTCTYGVCERNTCLPVRSCSGSACDVCGTQAFVEPWDAGTAAWRTVDGGSIVVLSDASACRGPFMRETVLYSGGRTFTRAGIAVRAGQVYCLSSWIRGSANTQPFVGINASTAAGTVGTEHWLIGSECYPSGFAVPVSPVRPDGQWHWYAREFTMPNYTHVVIKTEIFSAGAPGTADFDAIQLVDGRCPEAPPAVCAASSCE